MKKFVLISFLFGCGELGIGLVPIFSQELSVIESAAPGYPRLPSGGRESGEVRVKIAINAEGMVTSAAASSGPESLRASAERAALKWKFEKSDHLMTKELEFAFITRLNLGDPPQISVVFKKPNRIEVFAEQRNIVIMADPAMVDVDKERKEKKK